MTARRGAIPCLALAVALAWPRAARADAPPLDLAWKAPPECPDAAALVARVGALVGPDHEGRRRLSAAGHVTKTPSGYRLALTVDGAPRVMTHADCTKLADAAALVLALDIDPDALSPKAPPATPSVPVTSETPAQGPPAIAPPPPSPSRAPFAHAPPPTRLDVGARTVVDTGSLPRVALGVAGTVAVAHGPLAVEVGPTLFAPRFSAHGPHGDAGGALVGLLAVTLHGCVGDGSRVADLRVCLGGELGREWTEGVGLSERATSAGLRGALSGLVRIRLLPRAPISPVLGISAGHTTTAPRVVVQGFGTVFESAGPFFRAFFGLEAPFFTSE